MCGVDTEVGEGLGVEYQVKVNALLEIPVSSTTSSGAGSGDANEEFQVAVAWWLGVDPEAVSVSMYKTEVGRSEERRPGAMRACRKRVCLDCSIELSRCLFGTRDSWRNRS